MASFQRRYYAGGGTTTTLANPMGITDTSFNITSSTGWPGASPADFIVVIDRGTASEEKILCSTESGITVTVASGGRGYDGTSAIAHNAGATVSLVGGAIDFDEANQISHLLGNGTSGYILEGGGTGALPSWVANSSGNMNTSTYDPAAIAQQVVGTTATQTLTNKTLTSPSVDELTVTGIGGSVTASRYVGATTSGAPTTGTYLLGDWVTTQDGNIYICTTAGTPGTWTKVGGGSSALSYVESYITANVSVAAATPTNITSVSLAAGTWLISGRCVVEDGAGTAEFSDMWIGPNSASTSGAYAGTTERTGIATDSTYTGQPELTKVVVLTASATVYLCMQTTTDSVTVLATSAQVSAPNVSGITAVKIA